MLSSRIAMILTQQPLNEILPNTLSQNCFSSRPWFQRKRLMLTRSFLRRNLLAKKKGRNSSKTKEKREEDTARKGQQKLAEIFSDESVWRKSLLGFLGLNLRVQPTQRIAKSCNKDQRLHEALRILRSSFLPSSPNPLSFSLSSLLSPLFFYM